MFVIGSPQAARELSSDLVSQVKAVRSAIETLSNELKALGGSYQDEGYEEMQMTVRNVANATLSAMEPVSAVCKKLRQYADILERS